MGLHDLVFLAAICLLVLLEHLALAWLERRAKRRAAAAEVFATAAAPQWRPLASYTEGDLLGAIRLRLARRSTAPVYRLGAGPPSRAARRLLHAVEDLDDLILCLPALEAEEFLRHPLAVTSMVGRPPVLLDGAGEGFPFQPLYYGVAASSPAPDQGEPKTCLGLPRCGGIIHSTACWAAHEAAEDESEAGGE